jgi:hypothetical protein
VDFEPNRPEPNVGATVTDHDMTGFIWSENVGWINLDPIYGGVSNDGDGRLSGYAWGENVGWINFDPNVPNDVNCYGVTIDSNGDFNGWAWAENVGWVHFQSAAPVAYKVQTSWRPDCLSVSSAEYADWVSLGKPDCWCYRRQCRGDIDGVPTGPFHVAIPDLTLFKPCFNQFVLPPGCECADLDHMQTGPFRVAIPDLTIFKEYFNNFVVPQCDQPPVYTGPYNYWTEP